MMRVVFCLGWILGITKTVVSHEDLFVLSNSFFLKGRGYIIFVEPNAKVTIS